MQTLALYTVLFNNDTGAPHHLARVSLAVDFAKASPSSKNLGVADLDQVDAMVGTQRLNELDVLSLGASINEDAKMCLTLVKSLGTFPKTTGEPIVYKGILQHLLLEGNS